MREEREFHGNSFNDRPVPLLRLPFLHCDAWTADTDFPILGGWAVPYGPQTSRYHFEFVATGWEWVKVPAGTFLALRVESVSTVAGAPPYPQVRWFCPGVGIVRWERGQGKRGPNIWELVKFAPGR